MSQKEDSARGYIKGFQEGLQEAWGEIIKPSTKGYTSRELQIMAKTKKSMVFQRVQQKVDELERALGKKLTSAEVVVAQPSAQPVRAMPGWSYVVKEERPDKSFSVFTSILSQGSKGLCISRTHPDVLKQKYGFDAESIWLTKTETAQPPAGLKSIEYVYPNNLARPPPPAGDSPAEGPNGAGIIEGLECPT